MKKLLAIAMALALFLMSSPAVYPQARQTTDAPPPVAPDLVREGDLAINLVSGLEIGTAENEAEAETMLASAGIAPKNGWISDYPVTPDILGELEDAVAAAADSNRLSMDKDEALEAFESVSADLGLSVVAHPSGEYAEAPPPVSPQYTQPTVINNYYYREGPPVVTYYPPPPDYLYLYAWVPYPFWCSRFFFSGFFILHDFHKVCIIHKRVVFVSNHFFHRGYRRFFRVDPAKRRGGRSLTAVARRTYGRPLFTAEAQRGARSILQRSHDRMKSSRGLVDRNSAVVKSPMGSAGISRTETARQMPPFNGRNGVKAQTSPRQNNQRAYSDSANPFTALGKTQERSLNLPTSPGRDSSETVRQIPSSNGRTGVRAQTSPRQNNQRAYIDSANPFTALGKNQERSLGLPTSPGGDSSETARQMPAFNGRARASAQIAPQENFKAAPEGAGRLPRAPGRSQGNSSSSLPSISGRGFPGGFNGRR